MSEPATVAEVADAGAILKVDAKAPEVELDPPASPEVAAVVIVTPVYHLRQ